MKRGTDAFKATIKIPLADLTYKVSSAVHATNNSTLWMEYG